MPTSTSAPLPPSTASGPPPPPQLQSSAPDTASLPVQSPSQLPAEATTTLPPSPTSPTPIPEVETRAVTKLSTSKKSNAKALNVDDMWEDASDSEDDQGTNSAIPTLDPAQSRFNRNDPDRSSPLNGQVYAQRSFELLPPSASGFVDSNRSSRNGNDPVAGQRTDISLKRGTNPDPADASATRLRRVTSGPSLKPANTAPLTTNLQAHQSSSSRPSPRSVSQTRESGHKHPTSYSSAHGDPSPSRLSIGLPSDAKSTYGTGNGDLQIPLLPSPDVSDSATPSSQLASSPAPDSVIRGTSLPSSTSQLNLSARSGLIRPPQSPESLGRQFESHSVDLNHSTSSSRLGSGPHSQSLSLPSSRSPNRSLPQGANHPVDQLLSLAPPLGHDRRSSSIHKQPPSTQPTFRSEAHPSPDLLRLEPTRPNSYVERPSLGDPSTTGSGAPVDNALNLSAPPLSPGTPTLPSAPLINDGSETTRRGSVPPPIDTRASVGAKPKHRSSIEESASTPVNSHSRGPFSIWDYLQEELYATDFDAAQEFRMERISNFMAVPFRIEEVMLFGLMTCFDAFLYAFTINPLRFGIAIWQAIRNVVARIRGVQGAQSMRLSASHKCDIMKLVLLILACSLLALFNWNDAGKMYHSVRGQDLIKLYVIFNVLEIADRLCCSIGQDVLDSLFSRSTLVRRADGSLPHLRAVGLFILSLAYIIVHTLVLSYQMVALNVAINSYDHSLMSLLISNQFVEIKGSVFKKFEKENLFQVTCADIVERFQLFLMVCFIAARNLVEVAGFHGSDALPSAADPAQGRWFAPLFRLLPSYTVLERTLFPAAVVLTSEVLVDWLKHAFITKFNHIRPAIYGRFIDVLSRDLLMGSAAAMDPIPPSPDGAAPQSNANAPQESVDTTGQEYKSKGFVAIDEAHAPPRRSTFVDQAPIVSRRLGFAPLPLACLLIQVMIQIGGMLRAGTESFEDIFEAFDPLGSDAASQTAANSVGFWTRTVAPVLGVVTTWMAALLTTFVAWVFLVGIKVVVGMNLVSYAEHRWSTVGARAGEEEANGQRRAPIGMHPREVAYEKTTRTLVDHPSDNASVPPLHGGGAPGMQATRNKKRTPDLLEVGRYTMVRSRLW